MTTNQDFNLKVRMWSKQVRKSLAMEVRRLPMKDKAVLLSKSISVAHRKKRGAIHSIKFSFLHYGFFWDKGAMGLFGKKNINLKAHNWTSKGIDPHIDKLADLYEEFYGDEVLKTIDIK